MRRRAVALAAVLALAASCTSGAKESANPATSTSPEPWRGGTLRLARVTEAWLQLDPQKENDAKDWELLRCCLLRTLFSYNGLPASEGGAQARPDLAAGPAEISADGLTWTVHIKPGIRYAPPLGDVEITAQDFVRALMREAKPDVAAYSPLYYSVIRGFDAYAAGRTETIVGIETPDDHTLVFRLTGPTGDLPYRLAMAASAPIPPNPFRGDALLGVAEGHDDGYGRFLVASGPYMIEGSEDLDLSLPPAEQRPIAGYSPVRYGEDGGVLAVGTLTLVRNPSWDPSTDPLRAAYAPRIELEMKGQWGAAGYSAANEELAAAVEEGSVDLLLDASYAPKRIRELRADPDARDRVITVPSGAIEYITLNLAMPPFDDLHVRRAVAFAMDAAGLARAVGRRLSIERYGVVATHLAADPVEGDLLASYDPYPDSLERARQELSMSGYDHDRDGRCDATACADVLAVVRRDSFGAPAAEQVAARLRELGIEVRMKLLPAPAFYPRVWLERRHVALGMGFGWVYDYPNASSVFLPLFASSGIPGAGCNTSLLGATPSDLRAWGYEVTDLPSADARIDRCVAMTGADQVACWAELDRYLMEDVVPQIPYLAATTTYVVSERIAAHSYSVMTGGLALDRVALVPGSD